MTTTIDQGDIMDDFRESTERAVIMKAGELAGETQVEKFVVQQWSSLNQKWMDGPSEMYDTEDEAREREVEISGWDHIDRTRIVHRTVAVAERVLGDAPPDAGGGRAAVMPQAWAELIEGLTLMAMKPNVNSVSPFNCEHDTLNVMASPSSFTSEELARLEELGFHAASDNEAFYSYRFGSA